MTNLVTFPGLGLSFEVNRVAFTIGGMNIYWYGVLIATGIILAILFAFRHCAEFGIDGDSMTDVIVVGVVMAIVSARAYYVAMSPYGYDSLLDMLDIRQGGLAIYGGIIGAVIFGAMACRWRKIHIPAMLDLFSDRAVHRPLGQLCQPGSLWLQHHPALGDVQRRHRSLSARGHRHRAGRRRHRPHHAGPPHLPV